jgi:NADPH2:quinone reductase
MPRLAAKSASVTRPIIFHYTAEPGPLRDMAAAVFAAFAAGTLSAEAGQAFPLAEAGRAHTLLESRAATGPLILIPEDGDDDA